MHHALHNSRLAGGWIVVRVGHDQFDGFMLKERAHALDELSLFLNLAYVKNQWLLMCHSLGMQHDGVCKTTDAHYCVALLQLEKSSIAFWLGALSTANYKPT
eukprot:3185089-Amphidinium_carterae.1